MPFGPPPDFTEDDLLAVLERNLDDAWIRGLLDDPSSRSMFVGTVAVMLRAQEAGDENLDVGAYILTAPGRAPATAELSVSRPSGAQVTFTTAMRFVDERGMLWRVEEETIAPASGVPQAIILPLVSERSGYHLNSFEPLEFTELQTLPGGFVVGASPGPAENGTSDFLALHGSERGVPRAPDESDDDYRHRMLLLEDKVSPAALAETVLTVLDGFATTKAIADQIVQDGLRVLREPFRDSAQPTQRGLAGAPSFFLDDSFLDDLLGPPLRSYADAMGWFEVHLPGWADPDDLRLFLDDGFADDPLIGFLDVPAGPGIVLPAATLADELDRRRAGGVQFAIYIGMDQILDRNPPDASVFQPGAWLPQPGGVGYEDALQAHDGDDGYVDTATGTGAGLAFTVNDLVLTWAAPQRTPTSIDRVRLSCWARRAGTAVGVNPALLFVIQPTTAGAPIRPSWDGFPRTIDHDGWREYAITFDENPDTGAPWALADIAGDFLAGIANAAAVGATDPLRVSELRLELRVRFE